MIIWIYRRIRDEYNSFQASRQQQQQQQPSTTGNQKHQKAVVRDVCFGVRPGECFGLLGPNGAGKTTTLSMLTGEIPATQGHCVVAQLDSRTHQRDAFAKMGYCPQFDALWDEVTVREHLTVYAAIKGVPQDQIAPRVNTFIDTLEIREYADKVSTLFPKILFFF